MNNDFHSMPDTITKEQRSYIMSRIRGKNTGPEVKLRKLLYSKGIRGYRIHYDLPGKPDVVFVRKRIAIFVDGCFWHKCPSCFRKPKTRTQFWIKKINKNVNRDKKTNQVLSELGWTVIRIWEHEIKKEPEKTIKMVLELL